MNKRELIPDDLNNNNNDDDDDDNELWPHCKVWIGCVKMSVFRYSKARFYVKRQSTRDCTAKKT